MAFTKRLLTHVFLEPSGAAASGSITCTLEKRMTQNGKTLVPGTLTATLNSSGELSQELTSNEDTETVPKDARWRLDLRITGQAEETFYIKVPTGPGTTDLGTLLPQEPKGG
jgi:hypothetical protein